jgi:hypothetical protein
LAVKIPSVNEFIFGTFLELRLILYKSGVPIISIIINIVSLLLWAKASSIKGGDRNWQVLIRSILGNGLGAELTIAGMGIFSLNENKFHLKI